MHKPPRAKDSFTTKNNPWGISKNNIYGTWSVFKTHPSKCTHGFRELRVIEGHDVPDITMLLDTILYCHLLCAIEISDSKNLPISWGGKTDICNGYIVTQKFPSKSLYFIFMKNWFLLWRSCPDFDSIRGNGHVLNQNQGWKCGKLYWNTKKD